MNDNDIKDIEDTRNAIIRKNNDLIRESRFDLSLQQQKIMLYLISKINPGDRNFKPYVFSIKDFCYVCGIDSKNGMYYKDLKQQIKDIADKSIWIQIGENDTLLRWIEKVRFKKNSGEVEIRLDEDLKPFLLELKKNYTQYELIYTLQFKSKYSLRAYEYFKSRHYDKLNTYTFEISLEDLKARLGAEIYKTYQHFKEKVLQPITKELNTYSDMDITITPIKQGKTITKFKITLATKEIVERNMIACEIDHNLNKYFETHSLGGD